MPRDVVSLIVGLISNVSVFSLIIPLGIPRHGIGEISHTLDVNITFNSLFKTMYRYLLLLLDGMLSKVTP